MRIRTIAHGYLGILLVATAAVYGQVPHVINYQGVLNDPTTGAPIDTTQTMIFSIYSVSNPVVAIWQETQNNVLIENGYFSVMLGSVTPIPPDVFEGDEKYLGVKVGDDPEMTPRKRIYSVGYAFKAENTDKVAGQQLSSNDGSVNENGDPVSWFKLKDIPAGFADGTDDGGGGGGISQINVGAGMSVTNPTGPTTTLGLKMGHGNGIDADMLDGNDASAFATASHDHWGGSWSGSGYGLKLSSSNSDGVRGIGRDSGVYGEGTGSTGQGVLGKGIGANAEGVVGQGGSNGDGVYGIGSNQPGVRGTSTNNHGINGSSTNGSGVFGSSTNGNGLEGQTNASSGSGVWGHSSKGRGVTGQSSSQSGVEGSSSASGSSGNGVKGTSSGSNGTGVLGEANSGGQAYGIWGKSTSGYAGYFSGDVYVAGTLSKAAGSFKIDHPLDPANQYLYHSFVESPDMMNVYNGNITLDVTGEAAVSMPDWFESLNKDFRYQLTAIGAPGPNLYVAEEISGNRFRIAGGAPGMKVSWQVTGIRHDAFANAHRIPVEQDKAPAVRGKYLHPKELGMPESLSVETLKSENAAVK